MIWRAVEASGGVARPHHVAWYGILGRCGRVGGSSHRMGEAVLEGDIWRRPEWGETFELWVDFQGDI